MWRRFRDDPPGRRFRNHNDRVSHHSRALVAARVALGVVLIAIGLVLLFVPGPGVVVIAFGLGALAGRSKRLAGWLDRAEPTVRRWSDAVNRRWRELPAVARVGIVVAAAAVIAAGGYLVWRWFAG